MLPYLSSSPQCFNSLLVPVLTPRYIILRFFPFQLQMPGPRASQLTWLRSRIWKCSVKRTSSGWVIRPQWCSLKCALAVALQFLTWFFSFQVRIKFDRPFYGMVFSKGFYSNVNCVHVPAGLGQTQATFDIAMGQVRRGNNSHLTSITSMRIQRYTNETFCDTIANQLIDQIWLRLTLIITRFTDDSSVSRWHFDSKKDLLHKIGWFTLLR